MKSSYRVKYPASLYKEGIFSIATKAYKDICDISYHIDDDYIVCDFSDSIYDLKMTAMEFSNFLLEILNSRSMQ